MLKYVRIILVILFIAALVGASGLYLYTTAHDDRTPPVFHAGDELLEISVNDPPEALLRDLTATDNVDGDLTGKIHVKDISTLINKTDVNVTYVVFDEASNYALFTRTVRYKDYSSPRFLLTRPMVFSIGETVNFRDSIRVQDMVDGNISGRLKLEETTVINNTPGTYTASFSVTNRMGDTAFLPLTVQIVDNSVSRPQIELREYLIYLKPGDRTQFSRYLLSVTDPMAPAGETIPLNAVTVNASAVDPSVPGVYEVYYYYTGISGEVATTILTVFVQ